MTRPRAWAACVAICHCLAAAALAQIEPSQRLWRDEGLRLQVDLPVSWTFIADVKAMLPDAAVGAYSSQGAYAAILAERIETPSLDGYADLLVGMTASLLESFEEQERKTVDFAGREGLRLRYSGRGNGIQAEYRNLIFRNGTHLFQILCWLIDDQDPDVVCSQFDKAVSVLPGKVTGMTPVERPPEDRTGPGWRLRDGRYLHRDYRLAVDPPPGWKIVVGEELRVLSEAALVGLMHPDLGVYLTLIPERVPLSAVDAYSRWVRDEFATLLGEGASPRAPLVASFFGQEKEFRIATGGDDQISFDRVEEWVRRGDFHYRVTGGYQAIGGEESGRQRQREAMAAGLSSFSLSEAEDLATEEFGGGFQISVGGEFSVRGGVYRDFTNRFAWRSPGGCWTLTAPTEGRELGAEVQFENPCEGLSVSGWIEPAAPDPEAALKGFPASSRGEERAEQLLSKIATKHTAAPFLWSTSYPVDVGLPISLYQAVLPWGDQWIRLEGSGFTEYIEGRRALLDGLFGLLELEGPPKARFAQGRYEDHRLGFVVEGPDDWLFSDITPKEIRSLGSLVQWQSEERILTAMALRADAARGRQALRVMATKMAELADDFPDPPTETQEKLAGLPAVGLRWVGETLIAQALMLQHEGRAFMLLSFRAGSPTASWWTRFVESFRPLE